MRRAVTAIYRSYDVAALVRDELERLGIGRRHVTIIPDSARGTTATSGAGMAGTVTTPGADFTTATPTYVGTAPSYSDADAAYGGAFDDLHDLHLPEADTRTYQQAIRNGDYVVSVDVDDDADLSRIQEIMRRPEDAYDIDDLDTRYGSATYAPRRLPMREGYDERMVGRRDQTLSSPYSRSYNRDVPLWPRGGV
jgi:hypothetical protein